MGLYEAKDIESRFTRYVEELVSVIGHADRAGPFRDYCTGLVMPGERKSVEPMAAITAAWATAAQHQSLLHFVGQGAWSDDAVLTKVRQTVLPRMDAATDRSRPGSSTTPAFRKRGSTRWVCHTSIAGSLASRRIAGRGDTVDCQSPCEPSGGISVVFAERLGRGR